MPVRTAASASAVERSSLPTSRTSTTTALSAIASSINLMVVFAIHPICEEFDGHFYCRQCKRVFGSYNNLKNHLQSSKHVAKDIDCSGCSSSFVSRSALVLHYDVGGCPSDRVNLVIVDMMVRLLSKESNIIADIPRLRTNVTHLYVPVVAPGETSPHHDEKVYVCRGTDCGASFSLLSALVQHVDSEKCDASQHEKIVSALEGVLTELEAYLDK
ncbi:unnamed protein product [Cyclocybe aegerita]|uniref:C2H2-type domain-containing protein n=1 Tax=Cyclocybe aegerita TaxID=1973307 RepID=A0A8S0XSL1_CYCAE|nr:unnamed protein product [Cyclocybe aegerita]